MAPLTARLSIYAVLLSASLATGVLAIVAMHRAGSTGMLDSLGGSHRRLDLTDTLEFHMSAYMDEMAAGTAWAWAAFGWALASMIVSAVQPSSRFTSPRVTVISQVTLGVIGIALMGVYSVVGKGWSGCNAGAQRPYNAGLIDVCRLTIATLAVGWFAVVLVCLLYTCQAKL